MARVTSLLLLAAGAVVLVTWLVSPAASAPQVAAARDATVARASEIDTIEREVDRLHTRLPDPSSAVVVRDPFQFASSASASHSRPSAAPGSPSLPRPIAAPVVWPRLVAILSSGTDEHPVRQAVFEDANQTIQIRSTGESIDDVRVDAITADAVVVTVPSSEQTTRLSIR